MSNLNSDFLQALHDKDLKRAEQLLNEGADVNSRFYKGETAFAFYAVNGVGYEKVARFLLEKGADINSQNSVGDTALIKAIETNNKQAFNFLMSINVDLEIANDFGVTALMAACTMVDDHYALKLLQNNAEINKQSVAKSSPLLNAISREKHEVVDIMIEKGADLKVVDNKGFGVLHIIAHAKNEEFVSSFIDQVKDKVDLDLKAYSGTTPIDVMIQVGNYKAIADLVINGANPNTRAAIADGKTPLMLAAQMGNPNFVKLLLEKGADVKALDDYKNSVFHYAMMNPVIETMQLLTDYGMDINQKNEEGMDVAQLAVYLAKTRNLPGDEQILEALQKLVGMGYDPKRNIPSRITRRVFDKNPDFKPHPNALSIALSERLVKCYAYLLEQGADPNQLGDDGLAAVHHLSNVQVSTLEQVAFSQMAQQEGMTQEFINEQQAKLQEKLKEDMINLIDLTVEYGGDVNLKNKEDRTPIELMIEKSGRSNTLLEEAIGYLAIKYNADLSLTDKYGDDYQVQTLIQGNTSLLKEFINYYEQKNEVDFSILNRSVLSSPEDTNKRYAYLKTIKECCADKRFMEYKDEEGNTPLILAAATKQHDLIICLLEEGVDTNIQNNNGETAIMHSFVNEQIQSVYELRRSNADINIKNNKGENLHTMTLKSNLHKMAITLKDEIPERNNDFHINIPKAELIDKKSSWDNIARPTKKFKV